MIRYGARHGFNQVTGTGFVPSRAGSGPTRPLEAGADPGLGRLRRRRHYVAGGRWLRDAARRRCIGRRQGRRGEQEARNVAGLDPKVVPGVCVCAHARMRARGGKKGTEGVQAGVREGGRVGGREGG